MGMCCLTFRVKVNDVSLGKLKVVDVFVFNI